MRLYARRAGRDEPVKRPGVHAGRLRRVGS